MSRLDSTGSGAPRQRHGRRVAIETLREERGKCVVLCANCHAEVENNVTALPRYSSA